MKIQEESNALFTYFLSMLGCVNYP